MSTIMEGMYEPEEISYPEYAIGDNTPKYYDNSNGSLYLFAEQQKLNSWEFDLIKRIVRCRKKGNFKEDLEKSKALIDLYLKEFNPE